VHVEKSLAMNYDSARKMVEAARKSNLVLMENFQFLYHSQHQFVKKLVSEGRIGSLRLLRASFGFPPLDKDNFRYDTTLGGGVLIDAAAYMTKVSQFWLGRNLTVEAATLNYVNGVDIYGGAYITGENGEVAEVAFGMDNFYQCNYELWGSNGKITADRAYTAPPGFKPKITLENQDGTEEWDMDADNHFIKILRSFKELINSDGRESMYEELLNQSRLLYELKDIAMSR
jgi:dTDP-3,4-didehydro-2,6-dideoxy-alpha-D-glucose 3-reductase